MAEQYPDAKPTGQIDELMRQHSVVINLAMQGKLNATGSADIATSTVSSTIVDARVTLNSVITFMPTSAWMAEKLLTAYISTRDEDNGQFVITHTSSATAGTIPYLIIG